MKNFICFCEGLDERMSFPPRRPVGNGFRLVYRATEELEPNPDAGAIEGGIHALEALNRNRPRFRLRHRGKTANPATSGTPTKCHDIRCERVSMFDRIRKLFL